MNSNKLIERLEHALEATESRAPAQALGTGGKNPADTRKKKRNPKLDLLIRKVLSRGIDPHWLLTGEGCMYRKECHADALKEARELQKMEHVLTRVYHKLRTIG
jgi:hypothetical protein